jgi:hypothetical protein
MLHEPEGIEKIRALVAAMAGPPNWPAVQRVSATRQGVTGKYCNPAPSDDMLSGAEKSRELFQYTFTCQDPVIGDVDPAIGMLLHKHCVDGPGARVNAELK